MNDDLRPTEAAILVGVTPRTLASWCEKADARDEPSEWSGIIYRSPGNQRRYRRERLLRALEIGKSR